MDDFRDKKISDFQAETIPCLKSIDLSWNQIRRISSNLFENSNLIQFFSLAGNQIEEIPENFFNFQTKFLFLDISAVNNENLQNISKVQNLISMANSNGITNEFMNEDLDSTKILKVAQFTLQIQNQADCNDLRRIQAEKINIYIEISTGICENSIKTLPKTSVEEILWVDLSNRYNYIPEVLGRFNFTLKKLKFFYPKGVTCDCALQNSFLPYFNPLKILIEAKCSNSEPVSDVGSYLSQTWRCINDTSLPPAYDAPECVSNCIRVQKQQQHCTTATTTTTTTTITAITTTTTTTATTTTATTATVRSSSGSTNATDTKISTATMKEIATTVKC